MEQTSSSFAWPPPFTLRHSPRTRRVHLKICSRRGLEIIVPKKFDARKTPAVLEKHRAWIERTWQRLQPPITANLTETLPEHIELLALNETWLIHYQPEAVRFLQIRKHPDAKQLTLYGKTSSQTLIKKALQQWLMVHAKQHLEPWLQKLSTQTNLPYSHVCIRNNTGRWGSCSADKRIALNCKLLFLPPTLVEHVLLHELCHTVYLNHAKQFWDLLRRFDPLSDQQRKQLKAADKLVPLWLEHTSNV